MERCGTLERAIYTAICAHDGIRAKGIARELDIDHTTVNRVLYGSPLMTELCYRDADYRWHGIISQSYPHHGLRDICGYYSDVREFLSLKEESWLARMEDGCVDIGRNLNDTRGLFHSFRDCRETMLGLFRDLEDISDIDVRPWEIAFELRLKRAKYIRIFADVLVITEEKIFSLEFKMKDSISAEEILQAAKYVPYVETVFGESYDVIPALVLTRASELYRHEPVGKSDMFLPVCSGDMLFNVFDEYLGLLPDR